MSYASRAGRAYADPRNPRAFAVCQRCGIWYNRDRLVNQKEWRGSALLPLNIWVCRETCLDVPQDQLRAIALPADPVPVYWPLTEPFIADEVDSNQVIGAPVGLDWNAVMPQFGTQAYRLPIPVLSVTSNGTTTVTVTCSSPHGLSTNNQMAVEGLTNPNACGLYSINVISATVFTYTTFAEITAGALWQGSSQMITALVGLPYDTAQIPQVEPLFPVPNPPAPPPAENPSFDFSDPDNSQYIPLS